VEVQVRSSGSTVTDEAPPASPFPRKGGKDLSCPLPLPFPPMRSDCAAVQSTNPIQPSVKQRVSFYHHDGVVKNSTSTDEKRYHNHFLLR
jgi:hypothetical protein